MNAPLAMTAFRAGAQADEPPAPAGCPEAAAAPVIVVGGGPAGIRAAQELSRRGLDTVVFNAERWDPYNRVKLTPLLAGDVQLAR